MSNEQVILALLLALVGAALGWRNVVLILVTLALMISLPLMILGLVTFNTIDLIVEQFRSNP
jgi:hypothetical protein